METKKIFFDSDNIFKTAKIFVEMAERKKFNNDYLAVFDSNCENYVNFSSLDEIYETNILDRNNQTENPKINIRSFFNSIRNNSNSNGLRLSFKLVDTNSENYINRKSDFEFFDIECSVDEYKFICLFTDYGLHHEGLAAWERMQRLLDGNRKEK